MRRRDLLRLLGASALPLAVLRSRNASAAGAGAGAEPAPLQRGMGLGLFSEDPLYSYADLLREIRELGTTHVSLTVPCYQEHAGSTAIYRHPRFSPPDLTITRTLREARDAGLKVMVFPIVRLDHPRTDKEWRGTLAPDSPAAWWQSYEAMMLHLARLSAREGAAVLSVGSELSTLDVARERPRWARLCEKLRREFPGLLTYSGNWDHYQDVGLYEHVDLAGMCAYFPLAERGYKPPADMDTLRAAWRKKRTELEAFAARVGRPLLLTEVGYLSQRGAAAWPWQEGASEPIDLEDQRRCYQAFAEAWTGASILRGVYFWNYYGWGGRISRGYTPRHKPASDEIERYFVDESARPAL